MINLAVVVYLRKPNHLEGRCVITRGKEELAFASLSGNG